MAEIVGGFVMPHAHMYLTLYAAVDTEKKKAYDAAFAAAVEQLRTLGVDTVVMIGDDHYTLFA